MQHLEIFPQAYIFILNNLRLGMLPSYRFRIENFVMSKSLFMYYQLKPN